MKDEGRRMKGRRVAQAAGVAGIEKVGEVV